MGHRLQHTGLIAVLQEDRPVVINVLYFNKYGGSACPSAACWTVVYMDRQAIHKLISYMFDADFKDAIRTAKTAVVFA